jgi:hypothetical protein
MNFELIYHSIAIKDLSATHISTILETSVNFNRANLITGCLLYHRGEFIQLLEGDQKIIEALYRRIEKDFRHHHVSLLHKGNSPKRKFKDWSMAYQDLDKEQMKSIGNYLDLEKFKELNQIKKDDSLGGKLFTYISRSMIEQPIEELYP